MRVIAKKALVDFYTLYPDAKLSLEDWYRKTIDAQWTYFADIKKSFNSVDAVGDNGNSPNCKRKDSNHICHLSLVIIHLSLILIPLIPYLTPMLSSNFLKTPSLSS